MCNKIMQSDKTFALELSLQEQPINRLFIYKHLYNINSYISFIKKLNAES